MLTGGFSHRPRRPLRSQTYNMLGPVLSSCDELQDSAQGTDSSKDITLLDNGGISNLESVNLSGEVEHNLQQKQREFEELIFSSSIPDEGLEEGEISGDDGEIDHFLFGDSFSLEESKSDDLLVCEDNVENGNDGKFKISLDTYDGDDNNVRNLGRSFTDEPNVGTKRSRDSASPNSEDLDGGAEESHHEDIIDKNDSELEVRDAKKRKRGPLSEERKAKKRKNDRIKRAEKNKQLGVKRLKLEVVVKPKKVAYCRHYMVGRCYEGEKCKFLHDTTPLTKSTPCFFFARHSCMKGDDCPFDHELSKYPCNNFVSKGFCSRGADCLFKHAVSDINDEGVVNQHSHTTLSSLNHSTSKLSENQVSKKPIASKPEKTAPELKLNEANQLESIKKSDETAKKELLRVPKGINFLSSGKIPLDISANKEKEPPKGINFLSLDISANKEKGTDVFSAESVRQASIGSDNAGDRLVSSISTTNSSSAFQNPFWNQGSRNGVQRALQSTLAFAAKIDSGIRLNVPTVNPFDPSRLDS